MSRNHGRLGHICREPGCEESLDVYQCRGYCLKHYRIHRLAGEFGSRACKVGGCGNHAVGSGMCELHRNRYRRLGTVEVSVEPKVGVRASSWKGGRSLNASGYVRVTLPPEHSQFTWGRSTSSGGGVSHTILEHRLVMGLMLGRRLKAGETVHHINGDRTDNRIENLQLRQGAHGPGVVAACSDCGSHNIEMRPL